MFKYSMFVVIFVRLMQSENWVVTENVMESIMENCTCPASRKTVTESDNSGASRKASRKTWSAPRFMSFHPWHSDGLAQRVSHQRPKCAPLPLLTETRCRSKYTRDKQSVDVGWKYLITWQLSTNHSVSTALLRALLGEAPVPVFISYYSETKDNSVTPC